jgi:hypothetical protein
MRTDDGVSPDPETITRYITDTFPDADIVTAMGATFFSLDPDKHWPNFATIVTTDEHDMGAPSDLTARPDAFRLNLGVSRATFERLVSRDDTEPDYAAIDRLIPHPVYAKQHWVAIVNPSADSWGSIVKPLLQEAYDRVATTRARHRATG